MNLQDQRIVIIGGTSGIGLAVARASAQEGARVVIASRAQERVDAALAQLPPTAEGYALDVVDEAQLRALFTEVGPFDHLAYTAGEPLALSPLAQTDLVQARRALETRVWGAYGAVREALGHLREHGSITLMSGSAGARPQPTWSVAAAICGAMEATTRALALELAPVRVNAVAPGVLRTDLWQGMAEADRAAMYAAQAEALPVGRVGEAEDVAQTFLYLMANGFTTGTVVGVDGGALLV
jgi:NAD(P)-dependent dehydrogenase (short-subunit alcohol dehydrogenase family)